MTERESERKRVRERGNRARQWLAEQGRVSKRGRKRGDKTDIFEEES